MYFTLTATAQGEEALSHLSCHHVTKPCFPGLILTLFRRRRACRALTDSTTANCICGALFRSGDLGKHGGQAGL